MSMKGEVKFIKKQIFGGFSREDTASYIAKIAEERNEEREANIKAKEEINALTAEVERLKLDLDERKATILKLEENIEKSIIIKVVADKDTVIAEESPDKDLNQSADEDIIGDEIPEFEYDPDWHKKYIDEQGEPSESSEPREPSEPSEQKKKAKLKLRKSRGALLKGTG